MEKALLRPSEKLQTVFVQSDLDVDVCVGVQIRKETGAIVVLRSPWSRIIKSISFQRARFVRVGNGCLLCNTLVMRSGRVSRAPVTLYPSTNVVFPITS